MPSIMARRLLLLIAIALVLRGWSAGAMAGDMLAQDLAEAAVVSMTVHGPDCAGTHAVDEDAAAAAHVAGHCAQCHDCSLSALPQALPRLTAVAPRLPAAEPGSAFASAEPAPAVKPPIG